MKTVEDKLKVLCKVASRLNEAGIQWAVGASLLLYFKGIADHFNDIDIMTTEEDVLRLKEILLEMGTMKPQKNNTGFKTRHFYEFTVDETDVDVMAGFVIVDGGKDHDCAFHQNQVAGCQTVQDVSIPLHSVALWRKYYALMHRDSKVAMIDQALQGTE